MRKKNKPIRIAVTGGRQYSDAMLVNEFLSWVKSRLNFVLVVGDATGLDYLARTWADKFGNPKEVFDADWEEHGKAAGPTRNMEMANSGIDMLLSFKGGKGTDHMTRFCAKKEIPIIFPDIDATAREFEIWNQLLDKQ